MLGFPVNQHTLPTKGSSEDRRRGTQAQRGTTALRYIHCPIGNGDRVLPSPMLLGHEAAVLMEQLEKDIIDLVPGDRVVTTLSQHLGISVGATHAVIPRASVMRLETDVATDVPALLGCAVLTGGEAVLDSAKPEPGEAIVVVDLDGLGMAANPVTVALTAPDARASVSPLVLIPEGRALRTKETA